MTTKIDDYIAKRRAEDPIFATAVNQQSLNLDVAVARIEEGKMNVSVLLLKEIAIAANKDLSIQFI